MGLTLLLIGTGPAWAGTVTIDMKNAYSISDSNGNTTIACNPPENSAPTPALPPAEPLATPSCTLTVSPATVTPGVSSTLTAVCTPAATSYIWTGPGLSSIPTTSSRGTVTPSGTTPYSVTGVNNVGTGNTDTKVVTVSANVPKTGRVPAASSSLDEIKAWNYAFETLNHTPHNSKWEPIGKMNYYKLIQSNKPTIIHLPTSW